MEDEAITAAKPKLPTKRQRRILRHLRRPPGFFIDRIQSLAAVAMVEASWLKSKPIPTKPGLAEYRLTDEGRKASEGETAK